jgi:predicted acyl esterase
MGGYQQLVRGEVMRGKFRNSLAHPEPFVPDQITPVTFALPDAFHEFKKGHRVMVQVQNSWFPLIDRNPQRFVDIYHATEQDFQSARERVYHTPAAASSVQFTALTNP